MISKGVSQLDRLDVPIEVQVQRLHVPPPNDEDDNADVDYATSIRTTALRTVLDHAERSDGLVLNGLKLPSGHVVHINRLDGSGMDLEVMAYHQTNGLPSFDLRYPPYHEMYWQLLGLAHTLSIGRFNVGVTWVEVSGPGEKFWIRWGVKSVEQKHATVVDIRAGNIDDSFAFTDWSPVKASVKSCEYEGIALPAGGGTLLMQPGHEHIVIGTNTGGPEWQMLNHTTTLTTEHVGMWQVLVRIGAFWLDLTASAYCPDLKAQGWMDISYLSSMVVLSPDLDLRTNRKQNLDPAEEEERTATCKLYLEWRKWLPRSDLVKYHKLQSGAAPENEAYKTFTT
ncbi:hypothetical protein B0H10DRAFT_1970734 [Mycena sp. CBHHK59/15]|nr:hypothetical protein B0H10DRAFT_1970734 [Mycena sp. CBHHK59/15]